MKARTRSLQRWKISCCANAQFIQRGGPTTDRRSGRYATSVLCKSWRQLVRCPAAKHATWGMTRSWHMSGLRSVRLPFRPSFYKFWVANLTWWRDRCGGDQYATSWKPKIGSLGGHCSGLCSVEATIEWFLRFLQPMSMQRVYKMKFSACALKGLAARRTGLTDMETDEDPAKRASNWTQNLSTHCNRAWKVLHRHVGRIVKRFFLVYYPCVWQTLKQTSKPVFRRLNCDVHTRSPVPLQSYRNQHPGTYRLSKPW